MNAEIPISGSIITRNVVSEFPSKYFSYWKAYCPSGNLNNIALGSFCALCFYYKLFAVVIFFLPVI